MNEKDAAKGEQLETQASLAGENTSTDAAAPTEAAAQTEVTAQREVTADLAAGLGSDSSTATLAEPVVASDADTDVPAATEVIGDQTAAAEALPAQEPAEPAPASPAAAQTTWTQPAAATATTPYPPAPVKTGPRFGLVVWGLLVATLGVFVVVGASGHVIDGQLFFIGMMALAGLALMVTALVAAARRSNR
ncbi:MAG: hypothetical protein FWD29_07655 [Micrococcales bacterium]|nr:hypothetical protein [Micrococcales bacterium]